MVNTDYKLDALRLLLQKDCLSERYHKLTDYTEKLIGGLKALGCQTKSDAAGLSDEALCSLGLSDAETVRLFRRFLTIYDPNRQKLRELEKLPIEPREREAYTELYCLPGVKLTRADLYLRSGFCSLADIAVSTVEEIRTRTAQTIAEQSLSCIVPLPKEIRTHIAVARAFTEYE